MNTADVSQALEAANAATEALGPGLIDVFNVATGVVPIVLFLISGLGFYKMFKKAGESAWMAFIPLVRDYVQYKISWKLVPFILYFAVSVLYQVIKKSEDPILSMITLAASLASAVLCIIVNVKTAKSFGKGFGYGLLLVVFPFITSLVLGFGSAEYIGNTSKKA